MISILRTRFHHDEQRLMDPLAEQDGQPFTFDEVAGLLASLKQDDVVIGEEHYRYISATLGYRSPAGWAVRFHQVKRYAQSVHDGDVLRSRSSEQYQKAPSESWDETTALKSEELDSKDDEKVKNQVSQKGDKKITSSELLKRCGACDKAFRDFVTAAQASKDEQHDIKDEHGRFRTWAVEVGFLVLKKKGCCLPVQLPQSFLQIDSRALLLLQETLDAICNELQHGFPVPGETLAVHILRFCLG